jgi:hypothetical protein
MKELTDWFPEKIKPVRKGIYQVKVYAPDNVGYAYWLGACWAPVCHSEEAALKFSVYVGTKQSLAWRGLKK